MNRAATVHVAQRDGVTEHSLTKYGVRNMELDLRELADLVGGAVPAAEGREVDEDALSGDRAAERARDEALRGPS